MQAPGHNQLVHILCVTKFIFYDVYIFCNVSKCRIWQGVTFIRGGHSGQNLIYLFNVTLNKLWAAMANGPTRFATIYIHT